MASSSGIEERTIKPPYSLGIASGNCSSVKGGEKTVEFEVVVHLPIARDGVLGIVGEVGSTE